MARAMQRETGMLMRRRGFTLVELLVWVAVAAVVATVGLGVLGPFAEQRKLETAVSRVVAALEFARETARHEHRPVSVSVSPEDAFPQGNVVRLRYADDGSTVVHPITKAGFDLDLAASPGGGGVRILAADADRNVAFGPSGEPTDGESRLVLGAGAERVLVRVESPSGRVTSGPMPAIAIAPVPIEPSQP